MKKNNFFKTLGCLTGISAIGSIVPTVTTSCGCSEKVKVIPEDAYDINESDGVLNGWVKSWDAKRIINGGYNTMKIPESVTQIAAGAFLNRDKYNIPPIKLVLNSKIKYIRQNAFFQTPLISIDFSRCKNLKSIEGLAFTGAATDLSEKSTLKEIDLSSCKNLSSIGMYAFIDYYSLNSIKLPGSLTTIKDDAFGCLMDKEPRNISIVWSDLDKDPTGLGSAAFRLWGDYGTVRSTSEKYSSTQLLNFLQQHAGLPQDEDWTAID